MTDDLYLEFWCGKEMLRLSANQKRLWKAYEVR